MGLSPFPENWTFMSLQKNVVGSWRETVTRFCTHLATTTKTSCCRCISVTKTILSRSGVKLVTYFFNYILPNHLLTDRQWTQLKWLHWFYILCHHFQTPLQYVHPCVRDKTENLLELMGCLDMPPRSRSCLALSVGILGVQRIQILPWCQLELENLTTLYCLFSRQPKIW